MMRSRLHGTRRRRPSVPAGLALRPLALALACLWPGLGAAQLPTGFDLVRGEVAAPQVLGNVMTIHQASQRAIVDWAGFSIGAGNAVDIVQALGPGSVLLNRVTGGQASEIAGRLQANGQVFLVNPNGVLFGAGSQVNVGGLVASTLAIGNDDFMGGRYVFAGSGSGRAEYVVNEGTLTAAPGGTIALLGSMVQNQGRIEADGGTVGLVSARRATLDFHGDGLTTFLIDPAELSSFSLVENGAGGVLQADGGRVAVMAQASQAGQLVVNQAGVVRARALSQRAGEIVLDAGTDGGIQLSGTLDARAAGVAQAGGLVTVRGETVVARDATIDASGDAGGGRVSLRAAGVLALDNDVAVRADASGAVGQGGAIDIVGDATLYAYGNLSARGGAQGGDGGGIETSGGALDLSGLRADASAPAGRAGTWLIDPHDIVIQHGNATGSLPVGAPPPPLTATVLQDADISAALDSGTSVTIGTGDPALGNPYAGDIVMYGGTRILYSQALGEQTFRLQANRSVRSDTDVVIASTGGAPLNVVFEADAHGNGAVTGGGQVSFSGEIATEGGEVRMSGAWANPSNAGCSICLDGAGIDTRVGRSDAGPGGAVTLLGASTGEAPGSAGVWIDGVPIRTASGDVRIAGSASQGSGVVLTQLASIATTSGGIDVRGVATGPAGHGIGLAGALTAATGDVSLRGYRGAGGGAQDAGVRIEGAGRVAAGGHADIAGFAQGAEAGVSTAAGSLVEAGRSVLLRAGNDGGGDAVALGGNVRAGQWINARPGRVTAAGDASDDTAAVIRVGAAAGGFALSADELARLDAPESILGSDRHAADIVVAGAVQFAGNLSLQNTLGGDIALDAALGAARLTLDSGGAVRQAATNAGLTVDALVVRAGGEVALADAAGNAVPRAAIRAGGDVALAVQGPLAVGGGSGVGMDAAARTLQAIDIVGVSGDAVRVSTAAGDLRLEAPVSAAGRIDLIASGRFRNDAGASVSGGDGWRIWADSWVGEARGGLAGTGDYPNRYGCSPGSPCEATLPGSGSQTFVYAQQPVVIATIGDAARPYGLGNPAFSYTLDGLILGDDGRGITATLGSSASAGSPAGSYPIQGSFQSAEGYVVQAVPGTLTVRDYRPPAPPDVARELPQTYLYALNIAQAPVCTATGPLAMAAAGQQDGDVLAREWSRVRSQPQLSNCVANEQRNGCSDF